MSTKLKLKVLNTQTGDSQQEELETSDKNGEILIGRHPSCHVVLNAPDISRLHGRIYWQNSQWNFADLGSGLGSQVDNQVAEINQLFPLKSGQLIKIGVYNITVDELPTTGSVSAPTATGGAVASGDGFPQWSGGDLTVRCARIIDETRDVKTFCFVAEPPVYFKYKPGQFINLKLNINGKKITRSYSISSTPSRPNTLEITVKRVPRPKEFPDAPPGLVSNWLHDNLKEGDRIDIKGPRGHFTYFGKPVTKLLLISAGSGITPMMSMSRWICDTMENIDIIFFHSARSLSDIIYRQELESMAARYPNFKLAITTTRSEPNQGWYSYTGRASDIMIKALAPDYMERTVYVCGPNPFMAGVKSILENINFPMENYNEESFGPDNKAPTPPKANAGAATPAAPPPVTPATPATPPPVTPATSAASATPAPAAAANGGAGVVVFDGGKEFPFKGDCILELAEEEGIEIPSSCWAGSCGTCQVKLIEGNVEYEEEPSCETEPGYILTCCAKPVGKVVLGAPLN